MEAYLASCVVQSQQVLLPTHTDAHCKETTKSFEERRRKGSEGARRAGSTKVWGTGSEPPNPLWYEGKQVVSIIATDAGQCSGGNSHSLM